MRNASQQCGAFVCAVFPLAVVAGRSGNQKAAFRGDFLAYVRSLMHSGSGRSHGFAFLPAIPHQCLLGFRVVDPRSLLHLQHSFYLRRI